MSKYEPLWKYIRKNYDDDFSLSYEDINKVLGFPLDHSFLNYKKELISYGFEVNKISLKNKVISFNKLNK